MRAIILAAGRGSRMGFLTNERPKCLIEVYGKPLIKHQIEVLNKAGIKDISIVTGYKSNLLKSYGTHQFYNSKWAETNMVYSLLCAKEWLNTDNCIVSYSDIYYTPKVIKDLIECSYDIAIAYSPNWLELWSKRFKNPLDDAETLRIDEQGYLLEIGQKPKTIKEIQGQYMGLLKFTKDTFIKQLNEKIIDNNFMTDYLQSAIENGFTIKTIPNNSYWFELDFVSDFELVNNLPNKL